MVAKEFGREVISMDKVKRDGEALITAGAGDEEEDDVVLPGFRFHPTDEELVMHYLCRRCAGLPIAVPIIAEIDLYKFDPWQLPSTSSIDLLAVASRP